MLTNDTPFDKKDAIMLTKEAFFIKKIAPYNKKIQ